MAYKVFGDPITEETLREMPEYANKPITHAEMVRVALDKKNAVKAQAVEYMENLQKEGCDVGIHTLGRIFNVTGRTVTYRNKHDFSGKSATHSPYPKEIGPGQYGVFKHEQTCGNSGSCGAVVYGGFNKDGKPCEWMLSWSNLPNHDNKVFAEIVEKDHYAPNCNDAVWDHVYEELNKSGTTSTYDWNGCHSRMESTPSKYQNVVCVDSELALDA